MGRPARNFRERRLAAHHRLVCRHDAEESGQPGLRLLQLRVGDLEILLAPRIGLGKHEVLARGADGDEVLRVLEAGGSGELVHLTMDARDFRQAQPVDLVRRHVGRGVEPEGRGIPLRPVGQRESAYLAHGGIGHVPPRPSEDVVIAGLHAFQHRLAGGVLD